MLRSPILVVGLLEPLNPGIGAGPTPRFASWQEELPAAAAACHGSRPLGGAHWVACEDTSLDFHLRRVRVPDPADIGAVLGVVEPTVTTAFDVARALWELTVVDGLAGGRAAFALRFHHTVTDGVGGVELAGQLFDRTRKGRRPRTQHGSISAPRTSIANPLVPLAQRAYGVTRFGVDAAAASGRDDPAGSSGSLCPSPGRWPPDRRDHPCSMPTGRDGRLDVLEVPLARFEQAADLIGYTMTNDVFLAAVGGALRRYHDVIGRPVAVLRCTMPINLPRGAGPPRRQPVLAGPLQPAGRRS